MLRGEVPSQVVANRIWNATKQCDPSYQNLKHEVVTKGPQEQSYTIQAGDNLSKVSKLFYGNPNHYSEIAKENGLDNPVKIHPGQSVTLPLIG